MRVLDLDQLLFPRSWQDRQLCCLPFYYADPSIQLMTSLSTRGTLIVMRRFSVSRFWDVVRKYDATEMLATFSARLREETDVNRLAEDVLTMVRNSMQPTHASLWLRLPDRTKGGI